MKIPFINTFHISVHFTYQYKLTLICELISSISLLCISTLSLKSGTSLTPALISTYNTVTITQCIVHSLYTVYNTVTITLYTLCTCILHSLGLVSIGTVLQGSCRILICSHEDCWSSIMQHYYLHMDIHICTCTCTCTIIM